MSKPSRVTSPTRLRAVDRAIKALELRKTGLTFAEIAAALDYNSPQAAHKAVKSALILSVREVADDLRELEVTRLDAMLLSIWDQVRKGNHGAIDRALRIMERRAKLLGLDAPQRIQSDNVSVQVDYASMTEEELDRRIAELMKGQSPKPAASFDNQEEPDIE